MSVEPPKSCPTPAQPVNGAGEAETPSATDGQQGGPSERPRLPVWLWQFWPLVVVLVLGIIAIPVWRTFSHTPAVVGRTDTDTAQAVAVARVTREDLYNEVPIPAEFRPFVEVELHAKVSGYVQDIKVDFGDRVKAGQLLATLDVPELKDELDRAVSSRKKAEADYDDAHLIYTRLLAVEKDNPALVAQQELDTAAAKDHNTEAAIAEAKADVEKYQTLVAYTRITAPFDGVVTRRYVDPGALIQSGTASETQSLPVVRVSDNYHLRLDFPVSVDYVKDIHVGEQVEVRVESLGGKKFTGTITRSSQKVDEDTRTMMTEIEVPNPNLEMVPGMYAEVLLKAEQRQQALAIPIEAVPPGRGSTVYVVNNRSEIEERSITLGLQTPTKCEVVSGLEEGEMVLIAGRSQVQVGQKVEPKLIGSFAQE